ncbi:Polysaccharide deacetylase [Gillisia sp. Hel1_33_143]|uniref:polysaccharide deacetylase family protein n=1 Tax=Gillisia sp. Hel1_33_143 TaxID=1336796 RepID=UPI00087A44C4|nr:polysaccharide deacetylase family protein [Gillisia sp. Hel1_33_143]SDS79364.1 Polysaccharide deacetylase [Gillisia sp. Hel1_33_143]
MIKEGGYLVVSLDFELLWGVFDKVDYKEKETYFSNTKRVVPQLLELFKKYEVHVTWATVGMLFNENWTEWQKNLPSTLPEYTNSNISAYNYANTVRNEEVEEMCFAKDLILQIYNAPFQEIATHTYSHYYCLESGQTLESFKADLKMAITIAKDMGISLKSLVFPRNQFNESYLKVCYDLGIENVRSNPSNWYWTNVQGDSLRDKIFRTGDAYMGLNDKSYKISEIRNKKNQPISQKASRLLRSYSSSSLVNSLKLKRIKSEMTKAAKNGEIYHLWWHPHNFGNNPEDNIKDLREILDHYSYCHSKFGFNSLNMMEIGNKSHLQPEV